MYNDPRDPERELDAQPTTSPVPSEPPPSETDAMAPGGGLHASSPQADLSSGDTHEPASESSAARMQAYRDAAAGGRRDPRDGSTASALGADTSDGRLQREAGSDATPQERYADAPSYDHDPYLDVPASLELSYGTSDLGLSPKAYDHAFPYEREGEQRRRRTGGARARRVGRELIETVILALLIFFAVKAVVQNFRVEGSSMEPSLTGDEYLLVNKAIYYRFDTGKLHKFLPFIPDDNGRDRHVFRPPRRGDVIVFRFPLDTSRDFIKRVIGVPGDSVEVKDGKVFINGNPLVEDYILATPDYTYGPKTVPEGQYFVLGDNRRNSYDSHAWHTQCSQQQTCDFVPEENIIGQAWVSYWPFDALGFINNEKLKPQAP